MKLAVLHGGCVSMQEQAVLAIDAAAEARLESKTEAGVAVAFVDVLLGAVVGLFVVVDDGFAVDFFEEDVFGADRF